MEQLKIAIADKILEASAGDSEVMRNKLRRIQRFSDFSEALKSMMRKYPEIEEELLRMVNDDDFDTAKASRRVDYILNKEHSPERSAVLLPENMPLEETAPIIVPSEPVEVMETPFIDEEINIQPTETVEELPEINDEYTTNEFIPSPEVADEPIEDNEVVYTSLGAENSEEWEEAERKKKIISLVLRILAAVALLLIAYFVITNYWRYILITLAVAAAVYGGWRYYMYQKTKTE